MPGDISGPDLQLARPHTCPAATSRHDNHADKRDGPKDDNYDVELLEYEWPDLPPIPNMKDAICRQRVSKGISYVLPVDKAMNSVNSTFRTDLRAMFQEPYASEETGYDDRALLTSAQIHFNANAAGKKWSKEIIRNLPFELNSESEKARKLYARSAPATGSRTAGLDIDKMRPRSSLFLPIKAQEHPEAIKLRQEVEKIVESVNFDECRNDDVQSYGARPSPIPDREHVHQAARKARMTRPSLRYSIVKANSPRLSVQQGAGSDKFKQFMSKKTSRLKLTAKDFKSYDQLKKTKPPKPIIPPELRSEYLSDNRNQEIWEWLHHDDTMTDFEFFLSVCG